MSKNTRKRSMKDVFSNAQSMFATVASEMSDRYIEVEVEGISFTRLVCVYLAGARESRDRMVHGLRTLFRLTPAH